MSELKRYVYSPNHKQYFFDRIVNLISASPIKEGHGGATFTIGTDFIDYVIAPHPLHDNLPKWIFEEKDYVIKTPKDVIDFYNVLNWSLIENKLK